MPVDSGLFFRPLTGGHSAPAGDQMGGVVGLRLDHSRADVARAIMEGTAYELRLALDQIRRSGMPITKMWMIGGAAQSSVWPDIVANVTRVPLSLPRYKQWPAVGAAILAGVGIGAFRTVEEGQARFQRAALQIDPKRDQMELYDGNLPKYQKVANLVTQRRIDEEQSK
jgi:xylulokinase